MNSWPIQTRILLFAVIFLVVISGILVATTLSAAFDHSSRQLEQQFDNTKEVLNYKFENDARALRDTIEVASRTFSIKQLIAGMKEDGQSLISALTNLKQRSSASFVAVLDYQSDFYISSSNAFTFAHLANTPPNEGFVRLNGQGLYLVAVTPVKFVESQANPNAWIMIGKKVDELIGEETKSLTPFDIFFLDNQQVYASTSSNRTLAILLSENAGDFSFRNVTSQNNDYVVKGYALTDKGSDSYALYFASHRQAAYLNFENVSARIAIEIALAVLVAVGVSYFIARSISKPMKVIETAAKNIQKGDYQTKFPLFSIPELNNLAVTFEQMQSGINQREQAIEQLAYQDSLTELPNRNAYLEKLNQMIEQDEHKLGFAVVLIDLNRFKEINDTIGHDAGDILLKEVGLRLAAINIAEGSVFNTGGDEFAYILPVLDSTSLKVNVEQIAKVFETPFQINGVYLDVDSGIGIACYPEHASNAQKLMQYADIALYESKAGHGEVTYYRDEFNHYSVQRLNLMSELRMAIEESHLSLFYQPKLEVASNKITSVECLVRWIHPTHGFISPDDFIPLAEQTGAIRELTKWVINEAIQQYCDWREKGIDLQMSVNISAYDLVDYQLVSLVGSLLNKHNIDASKLKIEVTESAIMKDAVQAIDTLNMLKKLGVKLSIDDFGTGYSSMSQLRDMPVDELKIDKSFVMDLPGNTGNKKIVASTVGLAHSLGLEVVAEGVETLEGLEFLKSVKVELLQGYYIAKPMNGIDATEWLTENRNYE